MHPGPLPATDPLTCRPTHSPPQKIAPPPCPPQVLDLPTNRVQILVDGLRAANLAMGRTDGPANFAGVDPWVGLGRCLLRVGPTGELETSHQFVGCLFGLRPRPLP